ncbi:hypothetical protein DdX_00985 [Ditylenchus destructor]|uniref:Uncharacterized protein n=1 Tax=Ditylenchus destructor TaxID=166010 RepID=A0AAD4RDE2_9BILA|nr:hypothetical protein DdX_00985 [Ditylenchus destructor]
MSAKSTKQVEKDLDIRRQASKKIRTSPSHQAILHRHIFRSDCDVNQMTHCGQYLRSIEYLLRMENNFVSNGVIVQLDEKLSLF